MRNSIKFAKMEPGFVAIYVLIDPRTHEIKYVGQSCDPYNRWQMHYGVTCFPYQAQDYRGWLTELRDAGIKPVMNIIDIVPKSKAYQSEYEWICRLLRHGSPLVNREIYIGRRGFGRRILVPLNMTLRDYIYPTCG